MEDKIDFIELVERTKTLTGFTAQQENLLREIGPYVKPHLARITAAFYEILQTIPKTDQFLEGRTDALKQTHERWLDSLFTGPFDAQYAKGMYQVGMAHVRVKLPVEFMQGAATLIIGELVGLVTELFRHDPDKIGASIAAINAVIGFSVTIMQESYQASSLAEELEKFLAITGMSRVLFNNLAQAYNN